MIFIISDMLFPLWWLVLMGISIKKGIAAWKAWGIATTFVLAQAYVIGKTIGWNLGSYFIVYVGFLPSRLLTIFGAPPDNILTKDVLVWWIFPILFLLILPVLCIYLWSKVRKKMHNMRVQN